MGGVGTALGSRLLDPQLTAAVVFGAHDWSDAGLGRAPSFLRSAQGVIAYLQDGLGLDSDLVLNLFDSTASAGDQLAEIKDAFDTRLRERRDKRRPVADVLVYYVGHGYTDDQGHLSLLVRRSRKDMEAETGIKAPNLARVLRISAPQQRRMIVLDCCFSEAAAKDFIGQAGALNQAVASIAKNDLASDQPQRGTLLLCSSPVGDVSMGPPNAAYTLFTGAVLDILHQGVEGKPPALSFADLRDAAYHRMVESFGANAPRPVLHQVNAAQGDLTRTPAFPNRDHARCAAEERARQEVVGICRAFDGLDVGSMAAPRRAHDTRRVQSELQAWLSNFLNRTRNKLVLLCILSVNIVVFLFFVCEYVAHVTGRHDIIHALEQLDLHAPSPSPASERGALQPSVAALLRSLSGKEGAARDDALGSGLAQLDSGIRLDVSEALALLGSIRGAFRRDAIVDWLLPRMTKPLSPDDAAELLAELTPYDRSSLLLSLAGCIRRPISAASVEHLLYDVEPASRPVLFRLLQAPSSCTSLVSGTK